MKTIKVKFDDLENGDWLLLKGLTNKGFEVIGRVTDIGRTWLHKHPIIYIDYLTYQWNRDFEGGSVATESVFYTKEDMKEFTKIIGDNLANNFKDK